MACLLFCVSFFTLFISTFANCRPNGTLYNDICYVAYSNQRNFYDAEAHCAQQGGHLAAIHDAFTNKFLADLAKPIVGIENYWIGGYYFNNLNTYNAFWTWVDYESFEYTNWGPGQPLYNSSSYCIVQIPLSGKWGVVECTVGKPYVCEYTNASQSCPNPGWTTFSNVFNGCIQYMQDGYAWPNALLNCEDYGANLISIHNDYQQSLAQLLLLEAQIYENGIVWIGLHDPQNDGNYTWMDSTKLDYKYFDISTLSKDQCGVIHNDYRWGIYGCSGILYGYFCVYSFG
uniref:C-type lectin domain-containing protein n=1 Tax=Acrobeloides nanus TaxID=290746 RepID=A0A914E3U0_9BILA